MLNKAPTNRGFTLVELMITVAIAVILLALATPSFRTLLRNRELKSVSESVYQGMQLARAEAIRRNERVRFVMDTNTSWIVLTDSGTEIQKKQPKEGTLVATLTFIPAASRRVTFNSFGRVTTNSDASAAITQVNFVAGGATISRQVAIGAGGRASLCDPNVSTTNDPYKC